MYHNRDAWSFIGGVYCHVAHLALREVLRAQSSLHGSGAETLLSMSLGARFIVKLS
jgi:hypothetical protein